MRKLTPLTKLPVRYGFIGGGMIVILLAILFYTDKQPLLIPIFFDIRLLILPIFFFFAMKEFRDYFNEGVLHFWQGIIIGFITSIAVALCGAVFIHLLFSVLDPALLKNHIEESIKLIETTQKKAPEFLSEQAAKDQIKEISKYPPSRFAFDYFIKTMAMGLFFNIIISVILRKQPK